MIDLKAETPPFLVSIPLLLLPVIAFFSYQLLWHPLAAYPGPFLGRCTNLYAAYHAWKGDIHLDMYRCHQKYGNIVRYSPSRILINSDTALKEIYSHGSNLIKAKAYQALVHGTPNTLTIRSKEQHGKRRRVISQAFSDSQLRLYEGVVLRHINTLSDNLSTGEVKDMSLQFDNFTFDIMSEVVFGMKYDALRREKFRYVMKCIEESNVRVSVLIQASSLTTARLDRYLFRRSIQSRNKFLGFLTSLLKERVRLNSEKLENVFNFLSTAEDPDTGAKLTNSEIRAEAATLVVAGSDTSSTGLAGTMFYLSRNQHAYQKATREIRTTFPTSSEIRMGSKLNACSYLRACIDEAMRMSPPVGSALWREVCDGGQIIDSQYFPSGVDIGVGIYSIHHDARYFQEPFKYQPERWLVGQVGSTKESVGRARGAFYPFSLGPRSCVGKGLANHELMLTLARILRDFEFSTADSKSFGVEKEGEGSEEFRLWDHVTSAKKGPLLQFRAAERTLNSL